MDKSITPPTFEQEEVFGILHKIVTDEVMSVNTHGAISDDILAEVQKLQIQFGLKIAVTAWNECIKYHYAKFDRTVDDAIGRFA